MHLGCLGVAGWVPILSLETDTPNIVIEMVHDDWRHFLALPRLQPPPGASQHEARIGHLGVIVTVIGRAAHLLLKPIVDGVRVNHINDRFTTNAKGVTYTLETYSQDSTGRRRHRSMISATTANG
jgi:hypothetical protein